MTATVRRTLQLLALLAALATAGWVGLQLRHLAQPRSILVWFGACILGHDLVLFPLYSVLGRIALPRRRVLVPAINHIRFPIAMSALLLLVWLPLVAELSAGRYRGATGQNPTVYLGRWLLVSAALFAGSALIYAVRVRRARGR